MRYYTAQSGGSLPAFHGARQGQYGSGLGDMLRGIWRTVFPIALHGIGSFINQTLKAKESGGPARTSWGSAAKSAIAPTATTVISKSAEAYENLTKQGPSGQAGSGRRKGRPRKHRKTMKGKHQQQSGSGRRKRSGARRKRKMAGGGGGARKRALYKRRSSTPFSDPRPAKSIKFANF